MLKALKHAMQCDENFTVRQLAVLMFLAQSDKIFLRTLAASLFLNKPAICRAVDALARLGFAERQKDSSDHRNTYISLTADGRKFAHQLERLQAERKAAA